MPEIQAAAAVVEIRNLFARLESAEEKTLRRLGGKQQALDVLRRLHKVEGILREQRLLLLLLQVDDDDNKEVVPPPPPVCIETPVEEVRKKVLTTYTPPAAAAASAETEENLKVYPYAVLKTGATYPAEIDVTRREEYLSSSEFEKVLGVAKARFSQLPKWKRDGIKKAAGLF
ncbi:hypothetical protein CTAYLR_006931 [Chrysophaeum taylorii]|uniref:HP domain-containing protein n=1 Tax=Chrysophaeum taylorii TaxID=2483200 RepID=A0AAD7XGK8_9STRA|nr:hypothetical protein CTAYLR_006931 [Chrysophaeum taylorii]